MSALGSVLPIRVPVAHRVMTRVFLVLLIHLEADLFNSALLYFVLVTAVLTRGLIWVVLSAVPLQLCGFSDGRQEPDRGLGEHLLTVDDILILYHNTAAMTANLLKT